MGHSVSGYIIPKGHGLLEKARGTETHLSTILTMIHNHDLDFFRAFLVVGTGGNSVSLFVRGCILLLRGTSTASLTHGQLLASHVQYGFPELMTL